MSKIGVIPFQTKGEALAVLFVTSHTRGRWILPKGNMKSGESTPETCSREAFEEAGVRGVVLEEFPITVVVGKQTDDGLEQHPVTYYPFLVDKQEDEWPEKEFRQRHWALSSDMVKVAYREDFRGLIQVVEDLKPWLITAAEQHK